MRVPASTLGLREVAVRDVSCNAWAGRKADGQLSPSRAIGQRAIANKEHTSRDRSLKYLYAANAAEAAKNTPNPVRASVAMRRCSIIGQSKVETGLLRADRVAARPRHSWAALPSQCAPHRVTNGLFTDVAMAFEVLASARMKERGPSCSLQPGLFSESSCWLHGFFLAVVLRKLLALAANCCLPFGAPRPDAVDSALHGASAFRRASDSRFRRRAGRIIAHSRTFYIGNLRTA
jgi:hypothetical protein